MVQPSEDLLAKLGSEIKEAGRMLDRDQARFLVSLYYDLQEHRIALNNQSRTLAISNKPTEIVDHFALQMSTLERQMVLVLDRWTNASEVGRWSRAQLGVGPIIAAGFLAHIDIRQAPTVSHITRFAGLDPTFEWLGRERAHALLVQVQEELGTGKPPRIKWTDKDGLPTVEGAAAIEWLAAHANRKYDSLVKLTTKGDRKITVATLESALSLRPWNADLKRLCWLAGDSFVKVSNREDAYYGKVYRRRKAYEQKNNEELKYADQAEHTLKTKRIEATETKKWYDKGMLPPGRIDLRARRYAVKLFLAHWHHVAYVEEFGTPPPAPYPIAYLQHADYLPPPDYDGLLPAGVSPVPKAEKA